MQSTLYIPKTIVVGFQQRTDTFTGKLAYVIYKDHTGKLRKEGSWNSWRDHKIETLELENVPSPNFTLNKGVQRSREWFGSGRSMVRVWDPRDFEFEITVDNLLNVLMHADVSKRDITEPCVYAWQGTNLILLPTNSIEYQESLKHTEKQGKKFSSKDLVVGHTYETKKDSTQVVYLGRFERYAVEDVKAHSEQYSYRIAGRKQTKKKDKSHAFINPQTLEVSIKDPSSYIAHVIADEVHANFASLMEHYYKSADSQPIVDIAVAIDQKSRYGYRYSGWIKLNPNEYVEIYLENHNSWSHEHACVSVRRFARFNNESNQMELSYEKYDSGYYNRASLPGRSLPGMHKTRPDVVDLVNTLTTEYKAIRSNHGRTQDQSVRITEMMQRHKASALAFVLADGKIAIDHQL